MEYKNLIGGAINDKSSVYNCDCMDLLKQTPDNYYSLALSDPPYGIDIGNGLGSGKKHCKMHKDWQFNAPDEVYFNELFRISKNQIIWGANHFISKIPYNSHCWIVWDKENGETDFADCELAWTSFDSAVRKFKYRWQGMLQENMKNKQERIHPTEKPIALYKWLLTKYAKEGDKIFDSHFGSLSIGIACHDLGFQLDACELDKDYYNLAKMRLSDHQKQLSLF